MKNYRSHTIEASTLPLNNVSAYMFTSLFIILSASIPAICHLTGAPVLIILPMHWTVILAGLVYGWRGGALTGFLSPSISLLITGMPAPVFLFPMTVELLSYGAITGFLKEKLKFNSFVSVSIALISGRAVFMLCCILSYHEVNIQEYFVSAMVPGLFAMIFQILLIPHISKLWIK